VRVTLLAISAAVLLSTAGSAAPASPRDTLLVSTEWLAQHLSDPNIVIIHSGSRRQYDASHIPGARFVPVNEISTVDKDGLIVQVPAAAALRARLAAAGVSDTSRVIVYFDVRDALPSAGRVLFTLDYAGLGDRVAMLDGGLEAWTREHRQVTKVVPAAKPDALSPLKPRATVVDAAYVRGHLNTPGVSIIDTRLAPYYQGKMTGSTSGVSHRTGHIAFARSIPYPDVLDASGHLKSAADLAALFSGAGVKPGDAVITYCHVGLQATAVMFAARTLGYAVELYDGSFQDWSKHPDYPVDNPAKRIPSVFR
jgi:thiosulfate/3-mercaptopyruvate sulfurtransferase